MVFIDLKEKNNFFQEKIVSIIVICLALTLKVLECIIMIFKSLESLKNSQFFFFFIHKFEML